MNDNIIIILLIVAILILAFIFCPFITAWAINTIFGTSIVVTWKVWCAITWLQMCVSVTAASK